MTYSRLRRPVMTVFEFWRAIRSPREIHHHRSISTDPNPNGLSSSLSRHWFMPCYCHTRGRHLVTRVSCFACPRVRSEMEKKRSKKKKTQTTSVQTIWTPVRFGNRVELRRALKAATDTFFHVRDSIIVYGLVIRYRWPYIVCTRRFL